MRTSDSSSNSLSENRHGIAANPAPAKTSSPNGHERDRTLWALCLAFAFACGPIHRTAAQSSQPDPVVFQATLPSAINCPVAVAPDGTLYAGCEDGRIYALSPQGAVLWSYSVGYMPPSAPALGPEGTIYIRSGLQLFAISSAGALKWQYATGVGDYVGPAIAPDGTVYVGGGGKSLAAVDPNGVLRWQVPIGYDVVSGPSIGSDGTIYVGSVNGNLNAIDADGHFKWSYHTSTYVTTSPVIGPDGTVYIAATDSSLYAVNPDGGLKWKFLAASYVAGEPSIGADGTIYVGAQGTFYALNPDGTKRWETATSSFVRCPVITSSGSIYYGSTYGMVALAPDGAQRWVFTPASGSTNNVPVFGQNGVIYTSGLNTLYGLRSAESPAAGSWSMLRKSARHTASMAPELPADPATPPTYSFITLAGSSSTSGHADGIGRAASFYSPNGVAVDNQGTVFVADSMNHTIRKIDSTGRVTTLAGSPGNPGDAVGTGAAARFNNPVGVAADSQGNLYVADAGNDRICKISPDGTVTTLAGSAGNVGRADGLGAAAEFALPRGVAMDAAGNVYVADTFNCAIRKITPDGLVSTIAGRPQEVGSDDGIGQAASFFFPRGLAVDQANTLYVADSWNHTIRRIDPTGAVSTIAGIPGTSGSADGTGAAARFYYPAGVAADGAGNVFVTDLSNRTVRRITRAGVVSTLAGLAGNSGSIDGTGSNARFASPIGIAVDSSMNIYVADAANNAIRKGIVVPPGNLLPLADSQSLTNLANTPLSITLTGRDLQSHPLTYVVEEGPAHGTLSGLPPNLTYTPAANYFGADQFTFTARDSWSISELATVSIQVESAEPAGTVLWEFPLPGSISGAPAIAGDGTVYVATGDPGLGQNKLYALRSDGSCKWEYPINELFVSAPSVTADGTIVVGGTSRLYAINPDGTRRWDFVVDSAVYAAAAIAKDGTIYFGTATGRLIALQPDGSKKWELSANGQPLHAPPAIDDDGVIYVGNCDPTASFNHFFSATPAGQWTGQYDRQQPFRSPVAIANYGSVFFGCDDGRLYSYSWVLKFDPGYQAAGPIVASPTIATDGTIYIGSLDNKLYALNPDQTKKWEFAASAPVQSSPALDATGTIYFGSTDGSVYALAPDGTKKWQFAAAGVLNEALTLGPNGVLYIGVGAPARRLYALRTSGIPMDAPWPMFGHDPQHTGRAARAAEYAPAILKQPISQSVQPGASFPIVVVAAGSEPLRYQWMFNSADLPGATDPTLYLYGDAKSAGAYSVRVSNPIGTVTSASALVAVNSPPTISAIPDRALPEGFSPILISFGVQDLETRPGSLAVSAASSNPALVPNSALVVQNSGNTNRTLAISPVPGSVGVASIALTVTDSGGLSQSTSFGLSILADTDHDGMPDLFEIQHGFNPNDPQDGLEDSDGDGVSNALEYLAGTNPRDPTDFFEVREITQEGADVWVKVSSVPGKRYHLEWSDTGPHGPWATVGVNMVGTGTTVQLIDFGRGVHPVLYYRVVAEP